MGVKLLRELLWRRPDSRESLLRRELMRTIHPHRLAEHVLQLGGKHPAYVRSDADLDYTAAELVDGLPCPTHF